MPFSITVGHAQKDGRRYVVEVHTDAQGEFSRVEYLAPIGADYNAIATAREPVLITSLADQEARSAVDENRQGSTRFQTAPEMLARIRGRYLQSVGEETCQIARWFVARLSEGWITNAQCQTAFGVNPAGWSGINGRIDTFANSITSVESAVGE